MDTKKTNNYTAQDFANMFASIGIPENKIAWLVAQVAHETGNFKSKLLYDHNNATGITFANNSKLQKNATKGRPLPEDGRYNYAKFDTLKDWSVDYVRLINRGKNKAIEATTVEEYLRRLKANNFFTATIESYTAGVKNFLKKYGTIKPTTTTTALPVLAILLAVTWFLFRK
jgi:uncharacterized FlgJ-related protein